MILLLLLFIIALLLYYVKLKYFTLRGPIPGLSPQFLFGNAIQAGLLLQSKCLNQVYSTFKDRFGDVYQFWIGYRRLVIVSGIGDVQHIFTHRNIYGQSEMSVKVFGILFPNSFPAITGAQYKRHAIVAIPVLRHGKIISHFDLIVACVDKLLGKWRDTPVGHVHLNVTKQCQDLMLVITGLIGFDYELDALDVDDVSKNSELTQALRDFCSTFQIILYLPRILSIFYMKLSPRHRRAQAIIERHLNRIIEQELAKGVESVTQRKATSLIASLVASLQSDEKAEAIKSEEEKKGLSRSELLSEMLLFLVTGAEPPATAIAWFIYLMSKHPRVQQKIKEELARNSGTEKLSLNHLDSLVYLDSVINEVLRFSPPSEGTARTLTADDRLPESGFHLCKGDQVLVPFHNLTRDTRYWSIDPKIFYPERFLGEDKNYPHYALIPFGSGHRQCIGQDLTRFELKAVLARLMQRVTFGDGGGDVNSGGFVQLMTIIPKHVGVTIEFD